MPGVRDVAGIQPGGEPWPLHHVQPERGDGTEVVLRDAEQRQALPHPLPQRRSADQGGQEQRAVRRAAEVAVTVAAHHARAGRDALLERAPDRIDADDLLGLGVGEAHVEEALAAQRVQQEPVLRHGQQHAHRVRQGGASPAARARRPAGAGRPASRSTCRPRRTSAVKWSRVRTARPRRWRARGPWPRSPGCSAGSNCVGTSRMRSAGVRHVQQGVLDVGDPDVARAVAADRVGAGRPHLGVRLVAEQPRLHLLGQVQVLPALHRDDLLAADVAEALVLPDDPRSVLRPATVVHGDRHPATHEVLQQQGEAQPDRAAAGHRHPQHRRRFGDRDGPQRSECGQGQEGLRRVGWPRSGTSRRRS